MKPDAVLVNAARGPCIDEAALVKHLQENPTFRAGLDVFEFEPDMVAGLEKCNNAVIVPHIASASFWTRSGMVGLGCTLLPRLLSAALLSRNRCLLLCSVLAVQLCGLDSAGLGLECCLLCGLGCRLLSRTRCCLSRVACGSGC